MRQKKASSEKPLKKSVVNSSKKPKSKLFGDIMAGLQETQAHLRGELKLRERMVEFPEAMDVKAVRGKTGLSQSEFAARFHFSLRTLQEWVQGRAFTDVAVRAYLTVIARNHEAVERALAS